MSSPDPIAPVGVLHPISFKVQHKQQKHCQQQQQQGEADLQDAAAAGDGSSIIADTNSHIIEVPDDWVPDSRNNDPAAAAGGGGGGGGGGSREGLGFCSGVSSWESSSHIHIISRGQVQQKWNTLQKQQQQQLEQEEEEEKEEDSLEQQKQQREEQEEGEEGGVSCCGPEGTAAAMHAALLGVAGEMQQWPGLSWYDSVFVHVYLRDMVHFGAANEAYCQHLPQVGPPARACVQVGGRGKTGAAGGVKRRGEGGRGEGRLQGREGERGGEEGRQGRVEGRGEEGGGVRGIFVSGKEGECKCWGPARNSKEIVNA